MGSHAGGAPASVQAWLWYAGDMTASEKARENRIRRFAERQRYVLVKSRVRDRRAWQHGRYWLVAQDPGENGEKRVFGARNGVLYAPPGMTLNEAEAKLNGISWH